MPRSTLCAVICSVLVAFFATQGAAQIELKPAIGLTMASLSKDPEGGETKAQVGYQFGGTVLFGQKLYGEAGLFYTKKNTEITSTSADLESGDFGIQGLRIPAMIGFHLLGSEGTPLALRVFGGGSMFIVTKVDAEGVSKDDLESPTFGIFAGAGLDIAMFFVDLKYEWSLTNVSSVSSVDIGKSRSFFPTAGIRLAF